MSNPFLIGFFLLMIFQQMAFAEISFNAKITVTSTDQGMDAAVLISNIGKEDALKVYPSLEWQDQTKVLDAVPYIAFGGSHEWIYSFKFKDDKTFSGIYPLFVRLHYSDANRYPFSMALVVPVQFNESVGNIPKMITLNDLAESKTDLRLEIRLENVFKMPISGPCRIYSPMELEIVEPVRNYTLEAGEVKEFVFDIRNRGALPETRHNVFGVIEIEKDSGHITQIVSQTVSVPEDEMKMSTTGQIVGSVLLFGVFYMTTLFYELRRNGSK